MSLRKIIYSMGERFRNPSLKGHYQSLKESEGWSLEKLKQFQLEQLKKLVKHAWETVPYYRQKWEAAGLSPNNIHNLSDLSKIPVLTKSELLENSEAIHSNHPYKKMFKAVTSGTTGKPLKFNREESADSFNRASIKRGYSWYGVEPWERNGYFWGFNFSLRARLKTRILDALQNRFRLFSYNQVSLKKFSGKLQKAKYVHGYSSMIHQTAKLILQYNLPKPTGIKMVKGTSEKIYDSYKPTVQAAFGVPVISEYGATETGIVAFECPQGNMHINMEGVIVEEIKHKIVITNLRLFKFPVIRYELGDYIELAKEETKCGCGMQHTILTEVTGRIGESVVGKNDTYPSLYFYYIFKNLATHFQLNLTYFVVQHKPGELEFYIDEEMTDSEKKLLSKEITKYFGNDIEFIIQMNELEEKKGKTKSFISYL